MPPAMLDAFNRCQDLVFSRSVVELAVPGLAVPGLAELAELNVGTSMCIPNFG